MQLTTKLLALFILVLTVTKSFSQNNKLLDSLPTTRDGFIKSEPAVISTIDWLENTPLNQESENRKLLNAKLVAWLTNSPTVTIDLSSKLTPFAKKILTCSLFSWEVGQNTHCKMPIQ